MELRSWISFSSKASGRKRSHYLHRNIVELAERLPSLLPPPLEVAFFVNSGSEANDLALRLARARTRRKDTLVFDGAYSPRARKFVTRLPTRMSSPGMSRMTRLSRQYGGVAVIQSMRI